MGWRSRALHGSESWSESGRGRGRRREERDAPARTRGERVGAIGIEGRRGEVSWGWVVKMLGVMVDLRRGSHDSFYMNGKGMRTSSG